MMSPKSHNIKIKFAAREAMGPQPNSILIDGVEIPSLQYVWEKNMEAEMRINRLRIYLLVNSACSIALAIALILK